MPALQINKSEKSENSKNPYSNKSKGKKYIHYMLEPDYGQILDFAFHSQRGNIKTRNNKEFKKGVIDGK